MHLYISLYWYLISGVITRFNETLEFLLFPHIGPTG